MLDGSHPTLTGLRRLARWLGGALLALCLTEALIRQVYFVPDVLEPGFAFVHQPGAARWRLEGDGLSHWTAHGVRRPAPPADDAASILALGDSQTEALFLDDDEPFPARLEARLRARGQALPVLNAGRSGVSAADHVYFAPRFKRLFHPRWTIVELTEADLTDDAWQGAYARFARQGDRLVIQPPPPPRDLAAARFLGPTLTSWIRHTMLIRYASYRIGMYRQANVAPPWFAAGAPRRAPPARVVDYPVAEELEQLVAAYDGRVTILFLPPFDAEAPARAGDFERQLLERCRAHDWSCVTPRAGYPALAARHQAPYGFANSAFNEGHLNAAGHAAAAAALDEELRRLADHGLL